MLFTIKPSKEVDIYGKKWLNNPRVGYKASFNLVELMNGCNPRRKMRKNWKLIWMRWNFGTFGLFLINYFLCKWQFMENKNISICHKKIGLWKMSLKINCN
jgi:hypothetical protein